MSNSKRAILCGCMSMTFLVTSCSDSSLNSPVSANDSPKTVSSTKGTPPLASLKMQNKSSVASLSNLNLNAVDDLESLNERLAEEGLNIRLSYAETITMAGEEQAVGQTIFADDREKRLTSQWVPGDERRLADGNNLTYLVYQPFALANGSIDSEPEIDASFDTWNTVKKNPKLNIVKREDTGEFPSAVFVGGNPFLADITELGFLPGVYFDQLLGPDASTSVLGITFTFVFIDEEENPTDINNDGYIDTALKEIWYNDNFVWTDTGDEEEGIDIQTVALHENGHALGFGHFGKVFVTNGNNKLHVAPRAVMNAVAIGTQRDLLGTDKSSYNSIYGSWPK